MSPKAAVRHFHVSNILLKNNVVLWPGCRSCINLWLRREDFFVEFCDNNHDKDMDGDTDGSVDDDD